jgi:hypothetical protein
VWDDWQTVGGGFTRFEQLNNHEQADILAGKTLLSPVTIKDDLLWGSVFRFEPTMTPESLAAVFGDYDGQYRYVPGMPLTRTVNRQGKLSRVFHKINPVTFFADGAQRTWPRWLYDRMTYSYELDEEVFSTPTAEGPGYAIRWTIPLETQVLGAREHGEIMFTVQDEGTLITYNNATEPFGYQNLQKVVPEEWLERAYQALGSLAQDYYRRTVEGFIDVARQLGTDEIEADVRAMRQQLAEPASAN